MKRTRQTVYVVKVAGHPGHGGRFGNEQDAKCAQELLQRIYKQVRIVERHF